MQSKLKISLLCVKVRRNVEIMPKTVTAVLYSPSPFTAGCLRSLVLRYYFACFIGTSLAILVASAFLRYFATSFDGRLCYTFSAVFCPGSLDLSRTLSRRRSLQPCFHGIKFTLLSFVVIGITRSQNKHVCLKIRSNFENFFAKRPRTAKLFRASTARVVTVLRSRMLRDGRTRPRAMPLAIITMKNQKHGSVNFL